MGHSFGRIRLRLRQRAYSNLDLSRIENMDIRSSRQGQVGSLGAWPTVLERLFRNRESTVHSLLNRSYNREVPVQRFFSLDHRFPGYSRICFYYQRCSDMILQINATKN